MTARATLPPAVADRVAVVTGATGSLGRLVARDLAGAGMRVALVGTRMDRLDALASDLSLPADRWLGHAADLSDRKAAQAAVDAVVARFGQVHILVHLVGGWAGGATIAEVAPSDIESMLDQHLWTTFNVTRGLAPHLISGGWGRVIAISTPLAVNPVAKMAPYAIGKSAQEALLMTLAREFVGTGVTVNLLQVRKIDADHERDRAPSPGRASWTTPEEIVAAIRYLCTDEAGVINGARIPLHGG
jgi:NAD(P)-dependent dehydrogenase (short-subunit alcohol dehydrogenase family)